MREILGRIKSMKAKDIGKSVCYVDGVGTKEYGRVKSFDNDKKWAWVVYKCNNEWDKYQDYTGVVTKYSDLHFVSPIMKKKKEIKYIVEVSTITGTRFIKVYDNKELLQRAEAWGTNIMFIYRVKGVMSSKGLLNSHLQKIIKDIYE